MTTKTPLECTVCVESYDEEERRPRTLPCGHPLCSVCISNIITHGRLSCPVCRKSYMASTMTTFPINYGMEEMAKVMRSLQITLKAFEQSPPYENNSKKQKSFVGSDENKPEGHKYSVAYEDQLEHWLCDHQILNTRLNELLDQNKLAVNLLNSEISKIKGKRNDVRGQNGTEMVSSLGIIQEEDDHYRPTDDLIHNQCFSDVKTIVNLLEVRQMTRKALRMVETDDTQQIIEATAGIHRSPSTTMERLHRSIKDSVKTMKNLTVTKLLPGSDPVDAMLKVKVAAVEQDLGGLRCSMLTFDNGCLHLHTLLNQPTPPEAHIFQYSSLVKNVDQSCSRVFLDLSWSGIRRGRIYICLSPDTPLARQFLLLCTGQRGHSFRGTRLLMVSHPGQPQEWVSGGDYETNTGEGGAALVQDVKEIPECWRQDEAGLVWAMYGPIRSRNAQFAITTGKPSFGVRFWAFGQVESGLEVLREAVKTSDIRNVTVIDCGVIVPL